MESGTTLEAKWSRFLDGLEIEERDVLGAAVMSWGKEDVKTRKALEPHYVGNIPYVGNINVDSPPGHPTEAVVDRLPRRIGSS